MSPRKCAAIPPREVQQDEAQQLVDDMRDVSKRLGWLTPSLLDVGLTLDDIQAIVLVKFCSDYSVRDGVDRARTTNERRGTVYNHLKHEALNQRRQRARSHVTFTADANVVADTLPATGPDPETSALNNERAHAHARVLDLARQSEVLRLRLDGLPLDEIAHRLGLADESSVYRVERRDMRRLCARVAFEDLADGVDGTREPLTMAEVLRPRIGGKVTQQKRRARERRAKDAHYRESQP